MDPGTRIGYLFSRAWLVEQGEVDIQWVLDALILKLYSSILDCVKRFLTQLSIFLIILIFQFPQSVRQHALSMLTDSIIDRHGKFLAPEVLCKIFKDICVPLVGERIKALLEASAKFNSTNGEDILIELELTFLLTYDKNVLHMVQRSNQAFHTFLIRNVQIV